MEQIKCPNCGSFKTSPNSNRIKLAGAGGVLAFLGGILSLFFLWIVGIPMLLVGFLLIAVSSFMSDTGEMSCGNCNFRFKEETMVGKDFKQRFKDFLRFRIK